jgi:two-component system response regulator
MKQQSEVDVLLVEDNPRDAELTLRALSRDNASNSVVHDWHFATGAYAERDSQRPPKVALLDLKLPKLDGMEVLRAIRADDRTKLLPVVVVTSSQEERDLVATYTLGVNSYIVKPVDFDTFCSAVTELARYWLLLNRKPG